MSAGISVTKKRPTHPPGILLRGISGRVISSFHSAKNSISRVTAFKNTSRITKNAKVFSENMLNITPQRMMAIHGVPYLRWTRTMSFGIMPSSERANGTRVPPTLFPMNSPNILRIAPMTMKSPMNVAKPLPQPVFRPTAFAISGKPHPLADVGSIWFSAICESVIPASLRSLPIPCPFTDSVMPQASTLLLSPAPPYRPATVGIA